MSTDGIREIAYEYPKVILVDNNRKELDHAVIRRLLYEAVGKIDGDRLLFMLDADEFLTHDFVNTGDWKKIMDSKPGDSFCWQWMDLKRNDVIKSSTSQHCYWCVHESTAFWRFMLPNYSVQDWRFHWLPRVNTSNEFILNDFYSIHLARAHQLRQRNKDIFAKLFQ